MCILIHGECIDTVFIVKLINLKQVFYLGSASQKAFNLAVKEGIQR